MKLNSRYNFWIITNNLIEPSSGQYYGTNKKFDPTFLDCLSAICLSQTCFCILKYKLPGNDDQQWDWKVIKCNCFLPLFAFVLLHQALHLQLYINYNNIFEMCWIRKFAPHLERNAKKAWCASFWKGSKVRDYEITLKYAFMLNTSPVWQRLMPVYPVPWKSK